MTALKIITAAIVAATLTFGAASASYAHCGIPGAHAISYGGGMNFAADDDFGPDEDDFGPDEDDFGYDEDDDDEDEDEDDDFAEWDD
jgi:hypothetical protein